MTTSVDGLVAEFARQLAALTDLPDQFPHCQFPWEPRWDARPVLVATRRLGPTCQPHTLVTPQVAAVAYNRRGYGESAVSTAPFTHVNDLLAVLDRQEAERAIEDTLAWTARSIVRATLGDPPNGE